MRKLILVLFLFIGGVISYGLVNYGSYVELVPAPIRAAAIVELPADVIQDLLYAKNNENPQLVVSLSHNEYFYGETIEVSIIANAPDAAIYYTTNGSMPTIDSQRYLEPLILESDEIVKCVVIKAIAMDDTGLSLPITHSYFIGDSIDERFSCFVFSISTDEDNLYGYEKGILTGGITFDEYMDRNPDAALRSWQEPGNFRNRGREWERPVYVEAFSMDGERIVAQNAGMRVHGDSTRYLPQKSLRLIARREYEPDTGTFKGEFFPGYSSVGIFGSDINSFDTLILRNDGNDWHNGRIRTPLVSQIARESGFTDVSPQAAAVVFLNGEYYSYAWINIQINEHYLEKLYNAPERSFDIVDGGNQRVISYDREIRNEFSKIYEIAEQGLSGEGLRVLEESFDIDNLLHYYAIQVYIGNRDWPHNNMRMWRYTGTQEADNLAKELDGRWRFIINDADTSLFRQSADSPSVRSLNRVLDGQHRSPILQALLQIPEYAGIFANYICGLAFDDFSAQNVERVMRELDGMSLRELEISMEVAGREFGPVLDSRRRLLEYVQQRPDYILGELRELFGYTSMYRIVSDGSCKIGGMNGSEGVFFVENRVPVTPIMRETRKFDYWLVNGEVRYEENLLLSVDDVDEDGLIYVQVYLQEEEPPLMFTETFDSGELFGFVMVNHTEQVQYTQGLYLSDNIHNLKKWPFPASSINPGGSWEFIGRNSTSLDALLKVALNFNPRYGETVFLSNEEGEILDWVVVER